MGSYDTAGKVWLCMSLKIQDQIILSSLTKNHVSVKIRYPGTISPPKVRMIFDEHDSTARLFNPFVHFYLKNWVLATNWVIMNIPRTTNPCAIIITVICQIAMTKNRKVKVFRLCHGEVLIMSSRERCSQPLLLPTDKERLNPLISGTWLHIFYLMLQLFLCPEQRILVVFYLSSEWGKKSTSMDVLEMRQQAVVCRTEAH